MNHAEEISGMAAEMLLRDVINIPESVHSGDFKVELSGGFTEVDQRIAEYVVTDQLREAFGRALALVRSAVRDNKSHAAYLHGSFGSGKSHFLTVLHAVLNNEPAARAKPALQPVIAEHDSWLGGKKFLMVPYHLVGQADVASAVLGGYVATVKKLHPDRPTPAVYRADALIENARQERSFRGDDAAFVAWLTRGGAAAVPAAGDDDDDIAPFGSTAVGGWTTQTLDQAFAGQAGDPLRESLVSALLSGPYQGFAQAATGAAGAFLPLENGLAAITRHAKSLGYDGLILFLDELILWLQSHMAHQEFVNTQVSILVKLIESGDASRELPIVSFISRQRDLSKLIGEDVTGADVKNLEAQVGYLAERFDIITLEDRNLPAIIKERILAVKPGPGQAALDQAFTNLESANSATRDVLLDANGATEATWAEFKEVYPLSPALLNVLVVLSNALQRERTGLRLLQEMLQRRRNDLTVGQLIPLGDLWDVLVDGTGDAFTDRLRRESEAAQRFHARARALLLAKYKSEDHPQFVVDDRLVKTLLLSALAPEVPALTRLTGARLAALNHGSIRSRINNPGKIAVERLRELQGELGELRSEGTEDPVFTLHLSDLDIEPLLDAVSEEDKPGVRRRWVKEHLWSEFGVKDGGEFVCERDVVWRGTKRTLELVFGNVRDTENLPAAQFSPSVEGRARIVLDYPFDDREHSPADDARRVKQLRTDDDPATAVWLPHFLSDSRSNQLGKLIKIRYLLERDRLNEYAPHLSDDDRLRVRQQLQVQQANLTSQLTTSLMQLYGIAKGDSATVGTEVGGDGHIMTLNGATPRLHGGAGWGTNLAAIADSLFDQLYRDHPNFDPAGTRKAVTPNELRLTLQCITKAMENRDRRIVLERGQLDPVKRVVHGLRLGEVSDGPLVVALEWRRRIDQNAAQQEASGDFTVEQLRRWIAELAGAGLDPLMVNLVIATYALLSDRAWVHYGNPQADAPPLEKIGPGWALRAPDLPTEQEFAQARQRAEVLFGIKVPDVLFTRNVQRLADAVRAKVDAWEPALTEMRTLLTAHADDLGIDVPTSARGRAVRETAELLAGLRAATDATALVRVLARTPDPAVSDTVRALTASSAAALVSALTEMSWSQLATLRSIQEREDDIGKSASAILDTLRKEADGAEFISPLAPALRKASTESWQLIQILIDATRRRDPVITPPEPDPVITPPTPDPVITPPTPDPVVGPSDPVVGPSDPVVGPPDPTRPSRQRARVSSSAVETSLQEMLDRVRDDVDTWLKDHPNQDIDVQWMMVTPTDEVG